ncbi:MAG TPA: hypothetical protein VHT51_20805 [Micropepsaceae bacterium]|jgi:hypothetical protein|nr:hypothetical protein [Micropepsaceae bacterium]
MRSAWFRKETDEAPLLFLGQQISRLVIYFPLPLREGGQGEGMLAHCCIDPIQYVLYILENMDIPESQNAKILPVQPFGSAVVMLHLCVVSVRGAIDLDDEACRQQTKSPK